MAAGSADGIFRFVYDGCISGGDLGIQRRPYHRNCDCALHNKSKGNCKSGLSKCKNVSYPIRRSWSEGSLCLAAAIANNNNSGHSSPSSSPSLQKPISRCGTHLELCNEVDEETEEEEGVYGNFAPPSSSSIARTTSTTSFFKI